jgi:hypothetical protein
LVDDGGGEVAMNDRRAFVVVCLAAFLVVVGVAFADGTPEDAAQAVAESWLRLVDGGDYPASWDQAAPALKGAVKRTEWAKMVGGTRTPLGRLMSRKLKSRKHTDKPPTRTRVVGGKVYTWGGPGRYVVIQYDTVFANKAAAVETVIAMMGREGAWRVSGYSVR